MSMVQLQFELKSTILMESYMSSHHVVKTYSLAMRNISREMTLLRMAGMVE